MTSNIKIREASINDIQILARNNQALARETENIQLHRETLLAGVSNSLKREDCHYFVAELNGEVVGQTMITYEWSDWRNGVMYWIQSVYVQPEHRKKGLGKECFLKVKNTNGLFGVFGFTKQVGEFYSNESLNIFTVLLSPEIYLPIIGFFIILIVALVIKKSYFKE